MKTFNLFFILILLLFLSIGSCNRKHDSLLSFFEKLKNDLSKEKLDSFKNGKLDSAGLTIDIVRKQVENELLKLPPSSSLITQMDTMFGTSTKVRVDYLSICFHFFLNNKEIVLDSMKPVINSMAEYSWEMYSQKINDKKISIGKQNDSLYDIGDTIKAYLLYHSDKRPSTYYSGGLLSKEEKDDSTQTFWVNGIIVDKRLLDRFPSGKDSTEIIFRIKLLSWFRNDIAINNRKVQIGDTFDLYVTSYGAILDR